MEINKKPTKEEVKRKREELGLEKVEAARILGIHYVSWLRYEAGTRQMSSVMWELFLIKTKGDKNVVRRAGGRPEKDG